MVVLNAYSVSSMHYTHDVFGGNILATRDTVGEDSSFASVVEQLNITSFRYPGGSISEHYFDITAPNATSAPHVNGVDTVNLLPLGEFFGFLEENSYAASLVIPTRTYLSEATDDQGNRFAAVDEEALRGFINDVLDGVYGLVSIDAFEIGNEYWNSGGMTSLEYARVAAEMCAIIQDALAHHPSYEALFSTPRVLVQMGADYGYADLGTHYADVGDGAAQLTAFNADYGFSFGDEYIYSSGKVKWSLLANALIIREFENSASLDNVDGVVAHVYSKGAELPSSRYFSLQTIDKSWGNYIDDLFIHITEWNQSASTRALDHEEDFGLLQAHEMLNILEAFAAYEVGCARVWPLQQNTANDLSGDVGQIDLTTPGQMFALMSEHLVGTRPIQLNPNTRQLEHEISADGADIHAFYAHDRLVLFIASTNGNGANLQANLGQLIMGESDVNITVLGVEDGQDPNDTSSSSKLSEINSESTYTDQHLELALAPYEIAMVEILKPTYTSSFRMMADGGETFIGHDGKNLIRGGAGSDLIDGNAGFDTIFGGDGYDTVYGGNGCDLVYLNQGHDIYFDNNQGGWRGLDTIFGGYGNDTIHGGAGDDEFRGQWGNDLIHGGLGNDLIFGGDQFDSIHAGYGNDTVYGGNGRDRVYLNQGDDLYNDNVQGGVLGRDTVHGGYGADTIQGGNGNDVFHGNRGDDLIRGRRGDDLIFGGSQFDSIHGGDGNDTVFGGNGRDRIYLDQGDDFYFDTAQGGDLGRDTITGGTGADTFVFGAVISTDVITDFETGLDQLQLNQDLWGSGLSAAQVVNSYASVTAGGVLFDFGSGQSIMLLNIDTLDYLSSDIVLV